MAKSWEQFPHGADVGIRGFGATPEEAFEMGAMALSGIVSDPAAIKPQTAIEISCEAPDLEILFCDWVNALIFEMDVRKMLFSRFETTIKRGPSGAALAAKAWGEAVDPLRHHPAVDPKGATLTELKVSREEGLWRAQCVVDV